MSDLSTQVRFVQLLKSCEQLVVCPTEVSTIVGPHFLSFGCLRRLINLRIAIRHILVLRELASIRRTALVVIHARMTPYRFSLCRLT